MSAEKTPRFVLPLTMGGALVCWVALYIGYTCIPSWYGLLVAVGFTVLACVLHNIHAGDGKYTAALLLNAGASGFAIAAYFTATGLSLSLDTVLLVFVLQMLYMAVAYFLLRAKWAQIAGGVLYMVALIIGIALWCNRPLGATVYAMATLILLFTGFYTFAYVLVREGEREETARTLSFWSFTAAVLVAIAVILALSLIAGDGCDCDGCDCGDCGGDRKTKKKR